MSFTAEDLRDCPTFCEFISGKSLGELRAELQIQTDGISQGSLSDKLRQDA